MADDPLEALRAELDDLDERLVALAARRLRVVEQIAAHKAQAEGALFDRDRERIVLERARQAAARHDMGEEVGEALIHTLIEAGHRLQHRALAEGPSPSPRRVLVVGGRGEMGSLFARVLGARGHQIDILEKGDGRDRAAAVRAADLTLIAVDMAVAEQVARELAPHVRDGALIADVNSLKQRICAVYEGMTRGQAVGLHPMFGGTVGSLRRQKVVVCPVRPGPLVDWLCAELRALGVELIETDPATHDRMMGVVQVLLHFRTIVMGEALRRTGVDVEETLRFTSPIYRLELSVVARLFAQDSDLYASILLDNPAGPAMRAHFREALAAVDEAVSEGDREALRDLFRGVGTWFGGFSDEAMRMSDALIDFLVARA